MVTGARDWDVGMGGGRYCVTVIDFSRQRVSARVRGSPNPWPGQHCSSPSQTGAGAPSPRHAELVLVTRSGSCQWQETQPSGSCQAGAP